MSNLNSSSSPSSSDAPNAPAMPDIRHPSADPLPIASWTDRLLLRAGAMLCLITGNLLILAAVWATFPFIQPSFGPLSVTDQPGVYIAIILLGSVLGMIFIGIAIRTLRRRRSVAKLAPALGLLILFTSPLTSLLIDMMIPRPDNTRSALAGISVLDLMPLNALKIALIPASLGGLLAFLYLRTGSQRQLIQPAYSSPTWLDRLPLSRLFLAGGLAIALLADILILMVQPSLGYLRVDPPLAAAYPWLSLAIGIAAIVQNLRNNRYAWMPAVVICGGWTARLLFIYVFQSDSMNAATVGNTRYFPPTELLSIMTLLFALFMAMQLWFTRNSSAATNSELPVSPEPWSGTPVTGDSSSTSNLAAQAAHPVPSVDQTQPMSVMPLSYAGNHLVNSTAGTWLTRSCAMLWIFFSLVAAFSSYLSLDSHFKSVGTWARMNVNPAFAQSARVGYELQDQLPEVIVRLTVCLIDATLAAGFLMRRRWASPIGTAVAGIQLLASCITFTWSLYSFWQLNTGGIPVELWIQIIGINSVILTAAGMLFWLSRKQPVKLHLQANDPVSTFIDRLPTIGVYLPCLMAYLAGLILFGTWNNSLLFTGAFQDPATYLSLNIFLAMLCGLTAWQIVCVPRTGRILGFITCLACTIYMLIRVAIGPQRIDQLSSQLTSMRYRNQSLYEQLAFTGDLILVFAFIAVALLLLIRYPKSSPALPPMQT